jgi:hypothetical protein
MIRDYLVTLTNVKRGRRVQTGTADWHRLKRILEAVRKRHGWKTTLSETGHFPLVVRTHRGGPVILRIEDGKLVEQAKQLAEVFGP